MKWEIARKLQRYLKTTLPTMKKILLTISAGLMLVASAQAQSFINANSSDTTLEYFNGADDMLVKNNIKSATATPVTVEWKVTNYLVGTGWSVVGPCDNLSCRDFPGVKNGALQSSAPYDQTFGLFDVGFSNLEAVANPSFSYVKIQVKDANGPTVKNLTFIGFKNINTGISTIRSTDAVILFPNPAKDVINVIYDDASIRSVAVFNLIGRAVKVFKTTGNSAKIELGDVPTGVYFLRLMNGQGEVVATRKFNKQ